MTHGNRHFAKFVGGGGGGSGEEVVILGYREKTNDVLVCFLAALNVQEAQSLRALAAGEQAQKKDFLMDVVGGSVLDSAHHPSGVSWQTYLIQSANRGSRAVRKVTMKDLEFFDASQKAYFAGYGPSIEPEVDQMRKGRRRAQEAQLSGQPLPEPSAQEIASYTQGGSTPQGASEVSGNQPQPGQSDSLNMIAQTLTSLAEGQAALAEAIAGLKQDKPKKTTTTRKPRKTTTKKTTKAKKAEEPAPSEQDVNLFADSNEENSTEV